MQAVTDTFTIILARIINKARKDAINYERLRKALKLVNKWPPSERKAIHTRKIMIYMNILRGAYVACN
jgi:hypothetical protein